MMTRKFYLNFGFLHSNGDVIFPPLLADVKPSRDDALHEILSPAGICIEKYLQIPHDSRDSFDTTKTIICQVEFLPEPDENAYKLDPVTVNAYESLLSDEFLTDCTIECDDGVKVKAHRIMLSAYSSLFHSILQESSEICMKNVQHKVVREMLGFLYTKRINGDDCMMQELLKVANEVVMSFLYLHLQVAGLERNRSMKSY